MSISVGQSRTGGVIKPPVPNYVEKNTIAGLGVNGVMPVVTSLTLAVIKPRCRSCPMRRYERTPIGLRLKTREPLHVPSPSRPKASLVIKRQRGNGGKMDHKAKRL